MAIYKQGILGPFSGKVGTVVGTYWKGRYIMRGLAPNIENPRTDAQQDTRMRMSIIGRLAGAVLPFVNIGFLAQADRARVAPINVYSSVNLTNTAIQGDYPNLTLNPAGLQLSAGDILLPGSPAATNDSSTVINITWTDNSGISPQTLSSDHIIALLLNPARNASSFDLTSAVRGDETLTLSYPPLWSGETAYLYLAAATRDGSEASPSLMLAQFDLA